MKERKGIRFGGARPVICVPVIERTDAAILKQVHKLADQGVPMIEWRMDWYEKGADAPAAEALLKKLAELTEGTLLLCTYRTRAQGGQGELSEEEYGRLNLRVAESGGADLVDLEYFQLWEPEKLIGRLKEKGVWVVCSNHNFEETPPRREMERQLAKMVQAGGDFAKLAVMPKTKEDVLGLMAAVLSVKERLPQSHIIAMSMGEKGAISRLLGGWYGSEVTFALSGAPSAPGQLPYGKAEELIEALGECWAEGR